MDQTRTKRKRSDAKANAKVSDGSTRAPSGAAVMQPAVTAALTRALFEEWAARGYAALSLERVAKVAGVGKAALYRRWPSKLAMVTECLEQLGIELAEIPDTGTLEGDVRKLLGSLRRLLRHPIVSRILPDLHAEMPRNRELAASIRGRLQSERRRRAAMLVERAIARGELDERVDPELVNDILGGVVYWRMIVTGGKADSHYLDRLTRFVVVGMRDQVPRG